MRRKSFCASILRILCWPAAQELPPDIIGPLLSHRGDRRFSGYVLLTRRRFNKVEILRAWTVETHDGYDGWPGE